MEKNNRVDPTFHHRINKRNTFDSIFPVYTSKVKDFMSCTQSTFTNSLSYEKDSEFEIHNKDLISKPLNKRADRIVQYTESMLKIKNLVKLNRK